MKVDAISILLGISISLFLSALGLDITMWRWWVATLAINIAFLLIPIIRLEIEGMKHSMLIALSEYQAKMDKDIKAAVDAYCTPENITRVVRSAATSALDLVIKEEVQRFFIHGEGRKAVRAAIEERLKDGTTYTPLDKE